MLRPWQPLLGGLHSRAVDSPDKRSDFQDRSRAALDSWSAFAWLRTHSLQKWWLKVFREERKGGEAWIFKSNTLKAGPWRALSYLGFPHSCSPSDPVGAGWSRESLWDLWGSSQDFLLEERVQASLLVHELLPCHLQLSSPLSFVCPHVTRPLELWFSESLLSPGQVGGCISLLGLP